MTEDELALIADHAKDLRAAYPRQYALTLVNEVRRLRTQAETDTYDLDHLRADVVERDREIARLRALVAEHHNVSRTGNVAQLGRVCPVCRALDPETRAALGLDTPAAANQEAR